MLKHSANGENPGEVSCRPERTKAQLSSAELAPLGGIGAGRVLPRLTYVSNLMCDLRVGSRRRTSWTRRARTRGARTGDTSTESTTSAGQ